MLKNLPNQQNFKLKLLEIKKKVDGPPWFLGAQFTNYCYAWRFCEMQVKDQFSEHGHHISALEHFRKLISSRCVTLE